MFQGSPRFHLPHLVIKSEYYCAHLYMGAGDQKQVLKHVQQELY